MSATFTGTPSNANSIVNCYTAKIVTDAAAAADVYVNCGFTPRRIELLNLTDLSTQEWYEGMGAAILNTAAAGTQTNVAAGVTVDTGGVTLKAAILPASKTYHICIHG